MYVSLKQRMFRSLLNVEDKKQNWRQCGYRLDLLFFLCKYFFFLLYSNDTKQQKVLIAVCHF